MDKTSASIIIGAIIISMAILFGGMYLGGTVKEPTGTKDNVTISDGKQIVKILARGGYSPRISIAKADIPTILLVETKSSFDCSTALVIPAIGYSENLKSTGLVEIQITPQKAGTKIQGLCAMGMYNFRIDFE